MYYQNSVIRSWVKGGAPAEKLLLGFPVHARSFTLSTAATEPGSPVSGPAGPGPYTQELGAWSYYEVNGLLLLCCFSDVIRVSQQLLFLLQTCSFLEGTSIHWIEGQDVVYAIKGNQWVGFDNQRSYDAKVGPSLWKLDRTSATVALILRPLLGRQVAFLKNRRLGGAAVWTLDMDDFSGQFCGQGKYPLISHLKDKLSPGETCPFCHSSKNQIQPF